MTNTYEELNKGVDSQIYSRENIPMSLFPSFVDSIYKNDYVVLDINNRVDDYPDALYGMLEIKNVIKTVRVKISDVNGKVIGFIGIDYNINEEITDELIEKSIEDIGNKANEIGAIISVNKKREGNKNVI